MEDIENQSVQKAVVHKPIKNDYDEFLRIKALLMKAQSLQKAQRMKAQSLQKEHPHNQFDWLMKKLLSYKLIIAFMLIGISIVSGTQLNLIMDYVHLEQTDDRPELLELFNEGYTEVCMDDYYFSKKLTSCIMNSDYYIFEETETSYNIHNTNDLENFEKGGTHCAYYITVVGNEDNKVTYGCPFSWGNDWNKLQYKMELLKVDGFENDFLHIQTKYDESKFRPFGIENRNPDTMRFK